MKLSKFFLPLIKEKPSEAQITSHSLMLRSGMIKQVASGIYSWLPLGLMTLKNVESIIRDSMNKFECVELLMPCIQPAHLWQKSGRYDDYGAEMLRIKDRHEAEMLFGPTNEEMITDIFKNSVRSYKDLPKVLYQIQWKFRDEIRPRFGVLRGREFLMKDAYSFDLTKDDAIKTYQHMLAAYLHCFKEMGIKAIPMKADSGPIGGDYSHEFHVVASTGESAIFYDKKFDEIDVADLTLDKLSQLYASTEEKHDQANCPVLNDDLMSARGIEVGHIFYFGKKYSESMELKLQDSDGSLLYPEMGSYGIGVSRLVAAIIEANHDDNGIIWPVQVAPFKVSLINLSTNDEACVHAADRLFSLLLDSNIEVLYDDIEDSPGSKFARHDLIGTPVQIIVGSKNVKNKLMEIKHRRTKKIDIVALYNIQLALEYLCIT